MYDDCKIYGPYKRKDNREHVIVIWPSGKRMTVSYPKYLTEIRIERYLTVDETIDHIDCNFSNNDVSNIRILSRKIHSFEDAKTLKDKTFGCPECEKQFTILGKKLCDAVWNRKKKRAGSFCSRSCAGRYSQKVQVGKRPLEVKEIITEYITKKLSR